MRASAPTAVHDRPNDTGGVSEADQADLRGFQQADSSSARKRAEPGSACHWKRIIELHGGKIGVESRLGEGSTFAITLPLIVDKQAAHA